MKHEYGNIKIKITNSHADLQKSVRALLERIILTTDNERLTLLNETGFDLRQSIWYLNSTFRPNISFLYSFFFSRFQNLRRSISDQGEYFSKGLQAEPVVAYAEAYVQLAAYEKAKITVEQWTT